MLTQTKTCLKVSSLSSWMAPTTTYGVDPCESPSRPRRSSVSSMEPCRCLKKLMQTLKLGTRATPV
ncbi:hypothetical protein LINPERPRIM_LOCUS5228 [Linum perenne]